MSRLDGGKNWREATLEEPIMDKCLTRFKAAWNWDGGPAMLMSRAVDSTGYVQPTRGGDPEGARASPASCSTTTAIQPWAVNEKGEVRNAIGQA